MTTIQIIRGGEVIDERTAATPAGARKSLLAAIWRNADLGRVDDVSLQVAEREASKWDGRSDFSQTVMTWNARPDFIAVAS